MLLGRLRSDPSSSIHFLLTHQGLGFVLYRSAYSLYDSKVEHKGAVLVQEWTNKGLERVMGRIERKEEGSAYVVVAFLNAVEGDNETFLHSLVGTFGGVSKAGLKIGDIRQSSGGVDAEVAESKEAGHDLILLSRINRGEEAERDEVLDLAGLGNRNSEK